MKKQTFNITRGLKKYLLIAALFGGAAFMPKSVHVTTAVLAPLAMVAGMKKKGIELSEDEEKVMKGIETEFNLAMAAAYASVIDKDQLKAEVDAAIAKLPKEFSAKSVKVGEGEAAKSIEDIIREQGEAITKMEKAGGYDPIPQTIEGQIAKWQADNKEAIDKIKAGQKAELPVMHLKVVASPMTVATSAASPVPYYIANGAEIIDLVRKKPTFWNALMKGRTSLPLYPWVNKTNKQGSATFIGEGVAKAQASFVLSAETSVPKKVAETMKTSMELLYDVQGMQSLIEQELRYEVDMAANTAVLTGTASSTVPAGVTTIATAYALTTVKTTNPNNSDAIRASIAQLRSLNFDRALVAFVNPIDAANMDLEKANDSGVYMLPPFTTPDGRKIAGTPVVEDNNIAVGYLLIGDMTTYRILMYQDFFIQWGWENDDFTKNLMTVVGEMRFHQYSPANFAGSFIYDTFVNIIAAIDAGV